MRNYFTTIDQWMVISSVGLFNSVKKCAVDKNFNFYFICVDRESEKMIRDLKLSSQAKVVSLLDNECPTIKTLKNERSSREFRWTIKPYGFLLLKKLFPTIDNLAQLEADTFYYKDPALLIDELYKKNKTVLVTPHGFSKKYKNLEIYGKNCSQYVGVIFSKESFKAMKRWFVLNVEVCDTAVREYGMGDQRYLEQLEIEFQNDVYSWKDSSQTLGAWNIEQRFKKNNFPIFYHFSGYYFISPNIAYRNHNFNISESIGKHLFNPYREELQKVIYSLNDVGYNVPFTKKHFNLDDGEQYDYYNNNYSKKKKFIYATQVCKNRLNLLFEIPKDSDSKFLIFNYGEEPLGIEGEIKMPSGLDWSEGRNFMWDYVNDNYSFDYLTLLDDDIRINWSKYEESVISGGKNLTYPKFERYGWCNNADEILEYGQDPDPCLITFTEKFSKDLKLRWDEELSSKNVWGACSLFSFQILKHFKNEIFFSEIEVLNTNSASVGDYPFKHIHLCEYTINKLNNNDVNIYHIKYNNPARFYMSNNKILPTKRR